MRLLAAPLATALPVTASVPRLPKPAKAPALVVHRRRRPEAFLLCARIPRELMQRVRLVCVEQGRAMQDFVAEAIREWLDARSRRSR